MKTSLDPRHLKRQKIVQELFAWDSQSKAPLLPKLRRASKNYEERTRKIIESLPQIDQIIKDAAPEWGIEKINQTDLAVLRLAVFELCFEFAEPPKVIIDEAVELAKEFGSDNSPAFVNGALGKALLSKTRILQIIANKLGVEEKELVPQANLHNDLNATDLEIADLVSVLEKELSLEPPSHLGKFQTVGNILEYIEDHND